MRRGQLDQTLLHDLLYRALDGSDNVVLILEQPADGAENLMVAATNDAFCRASGFSSADLVGRSFISLAAPDANPEIGAAMIQAAREQQSYRSEFLCSRRDGVPFWLGLHLMPVRDSSPPCCVLLGRDITEALRDRQQHVQIQGLLAKVFVSVLAAVGILDERGIIVMTNPALDNLLGYPPGGLVGKVGLDLSTPEARARIAMARQRQIETGQSYTVETCLLRADGSELRAAFTSTLVEREDLKRFRIITVVPTLPREAASVSIAAPVSIHVAGKIRLIGLEDVRAALGARWPDVAARTMATAEHIVRRRCGPRDSWSRTGDSGFLICFGDATEDEAALRAASIAREMRSWLIGQGETASTAHVTAIAGTVELPDVPGRSPDMLALALNERLGVRLAEIEARARTTLEQAINTATCDLATVRSRQGEVAGHFATPPRALEHAVQRALAALPARESQAFDFDRMMLGVAAEQAIGKLAVGSVHPIMVAADFEVFLDRRRTERYIAACQQLDQRLRSRLILVLSRMPYGVPKSRVLECVVRIRPFCRGVGFQAESVELPPVEFSVLGASIVVLQESDLNAYSADHLAKLEKLIGVVRTHRARVLVREVSNRRCAVRLLKLGVDLVALAEEEEEAQAGLYQLSHQA